MQFILTGFTPDKGFRVFAFEGIDADRNRTDYTVRTDLALILRYGIRLQELPVLCRELLERRGEGERVHALTYTEEEMSLHVNRCAADRIEAGRKKLARRPPAAKSPDSEIGDNE